MTTSGILRPEDRYAPETLKRFRREGYWRDEALAERVRHWAGVQPDKVAVSDGYGTLSWTELHHQANRLAAALRGLGIESGERVQVQLPNWNEFVVIYAALARIGAVLVPTMPIYRWDEVAHAINHARAAVSIVCGSYRKFDYHQMIRDIRPNCPTLRHVITVRSDAGEGESRFEELIAGDDRPPDDVLGPLPGADNPHAIIFTSGTESRPKGCHHTFNTFGYTVYALGKDILRIGPDDTMFMPSPITHATGLAVGVTIPLVLGASTHVMDTWQAQAAMERIREHHCTVSMGATPFLQMILDTYEEGAHDLSSMRIWASAGAPIPPNLLTDWQAKFPHCALLPVYGRSEGLLVTSCRVDDPSEKISNSDGRALPGVDLVIRNEDGERLAPGEEGEICHGGPGLMLGYWADPERTAESIDPGGMSRTGDLGRVDSDGYLRITGRLKDLIIRGGTNISAREIEEHLLTHPKVAEVAVVGMPDRVLGERACAFVVSAESADPPTLDELTGYLRHDRKIAVVKLPERLEIIDELPMTATGKIQKVTLRNKLM
jgi:cyclohexanecarboxylate-CoA ligase/acyl-CoA synthetase